MDMMEQVRKDLKPYQTELPKKNKKETPDSNMADMSYEEGFMQHYDGRYD